MRFAYLLRTYVVRFFLLVFLATSIYAVTVAILSCTAAGQSVSPVASSAPAASPTLNAAEEQLLKEKLDAYSKRADDLQKLISVLLGISTVYAIVLAVSAYTTVQANLQQAEKSIARLEKLIDELPKGLQEVQEKTNYSTLVTMASGSLALALQEKYLSDAEMAIGRLKELRSGKHATDRYVNLLLGRLYKALNRFQNAEEVMTSLINLKEELGERDDPVILDAYYNRACYQSLRWPGTSKKEKDDLEAGIIRDLSRTFRLEASYKRGVKGDTDFQAVQNEAWFTKLVS